MTVATNNKIQGSNGLKCILNTIYLFTFFLSVENDQVWITPSVDLFDGFHNQMCRHDYIYFI